MGKQLQISVKLLSFLFRKKSSGYWRTRSFELPQTDRQTDRKKGKRKFELPQMILDEIELQMGWL